MGNIWATCVCFASVSAAAAINGSLTFARSDSFVAQGNSLNSVRIVSGATASQELDTPVSFSNVESNYVC